VTDIAPGPGDLAVFCPTCPQPGINIPEGWKEEGEQYVLYMIILAIHTPCYVLRWIYTCTFVMDGNFSTEHMKMRRKDDDAAMMNGTGFMTKSSRYDEHLCIAKGNSKVSIADVPFLCTFISGYVQRSSCHNHKAVNQTNTNRSNLEATGIGTTACAQHGCFVPTSVVDFQKGERSVFSHLSISDDPHLTY